VTEPPAEILRRLRPIPTSAGPPRTRPHDVEGVRPDGVACRVEVMEAAAPVLLLFLSAGCLGCRDLWEGLAELQAGLGDTSRLAVVTRSPGDEDATAVDALRRAAAAPGVEVVMSTPAYRDYRVAGPPFLAVAAADAVLTESVAWGIEQTLATALRSLRAESEP
jgi:hypothetical protein